MAGSDERKGRSPSDRLDVVCGQAQMDQRAPQLIGATLREPDVLDLVAAGIRVSLDDDDDRSLLQRERGDGVDDDAAVVGELHEARFEHHAPRGPDVITLEPDRRSRRTRVYVRSQQEVQTKDADS